MKTELTEAELYTLQDALVYKLLYLKEREPSTGVNSVYMASIMRLIAKLEAMKEEKYEDCIGTK